MFTSLRYLLFAALSLLLLWACNPQPEAASLLQTAHTFVENKQVDSAEKYIGSIFSPEQSLSKEKYMQYLVTRVRIRYKAIRDIKGDTAIFHAWKYYKQRNDQPRWTSLAAFYSGCVYREQKHFDLAMRAYAEAFEEAKKTDDDNLKGLVQNNTGDLFYEQNLFEKALPAYRQAKIYYEKFTDNKLSALGKIGLCYTFLGKTDSALFVLDSGLRLAKQVSNKEMECILSENISNAYARLEQYDKAKYHLEHAIQLNTDLQNLPMLYLDFSNLYTWMEKRDSADYYIARCKAVVGSLSDKILKYGMYKQFAYTEAEDKNYEQAFNSLVSAVNISDSVEREISQNSVYDIQQKYNFELLKNGYAQHTIRLQWWLFVLFITILSGGVVASVYFFRRKKRMLEAEEAIQTLEDMNAQLATSLKQRNINLRNAITAQCGVAQKALHLEELLPKSLKNSSVLPAHVIEEVRQVLYGNHVIEEEWEAILKIFEAIHPELIEEIQKRYPELTALEFQVCLLSYAGFRVKEIAIILNLKPNTIQTRRTDVRKKMGIPPNTDIAEFIEQQLC